MRVKIFSALKIFESLKIFVKLKILRVTIFCWLKNFEGLKFLERLIFKRKFFKKQKIGLLICLEIKSSLEIISQTERDFTFTKIEGALSRCWTRNFEWAHPPNTSLTCKNINDSKDGPHWIIYEKKESAIKIWFSITI